MSIVIIVYLRISQSLKRGCESFREHELFANASQPLPPLLPMLLLGQIIPPPPTDTADRTRHFHIPLVACTCRTVFIPFNTSGQSKSIGF